MYLSRYWEDDSRLTGQEISVIYLTRKAVTLRIIGSPSRLHEFIRLVELVESYIPWNIFLVSNGELLMYDWLEICFMLSIYRLH